MEDSDLILIEKYQTQTLSESDAILFREKRSNDKLFDNRVRLIDEIEHAQKIDTDSFKTLISEVGKEHEVANPTKSKNKLLAIALSLLMIIGAILSYLYLTANEKELDYSRTFAAHYETYPNTITNRGESDNEIILQAMSAYDKNAFEKANQYFLSIPKNNNSELVNFYRGICLMEMNQPKSAQTLFELITEAETGNYIEQSNWYLALTYLQLNDKTNAINKLNLIIDRNKSSVYVNKAKELLKKL